MNKTPNVRKAKSKWQALDQADVFGQWLRRWSLGVSASLGLLQLWEARALFSKYPWFSWQSPLTAVLAIALITAIYFGNLSFIVIAFGRSRTKLNRKADEPPGWDKVVQRQKQIMDSLYRDVPERDLQEPHINSVLGAQPDRPTVAKQFMTLELGEFKYPLRQLTTLTCRPEGGQWMATLQGLSRSEFIGIGADALQAERRLILAIHREFQSLWLRNDSQRDEIATAIWSQLEACIDVGAVHRNRIVPFFVTGKVISKDGECLTFQWIGGDVIRLPTELLRDRWFELKVGDHFEAVIWLATGSNAGVTRAEFVRTTPAIMSCL